MPMDFKKANEPHSSNIYSTSGGLVLATRMLAGDKAPEDVEESADSSNATGQGISFRVSKNAKKASLKRKHDDTFSDPNLGSNVETPAGDKGEPHGEGSARGAQVSHARSSQKAAEEIEDSADVSNSTRVNEKAMNAYPGKEGNNTTCDAMPKESAIPVSDGPAERQRALISFHEGNFSHSLLP